MAPLLAHDDLGRGAPWVLLHGFPLSRRMWAPQHALAEHARLVIPDLPGFGASDGAPASMDAMADAVLALADHLRLGTFGLLGLSMGGYVALALHRRAPERVAALVLADTQAGADTAEARAKREALARRVEDEGVEVLVEGFVPNLLSPARREGRVAEDVRAIVRANRPGPLAAALRAMGAREDQQPWLPRIGCPVLGIAGSEDGIIPVAKHEAIVAAVPRGRLVVLRGAGHLSNLEVPEGFNGAVRGFMAEAETQRGFHPARGGPARAP